MPLPMMGFEYVNGLTLIHKSPLRPSIGIMADLVVSDLLIYPFSFIELDSARKLYSKLVHKGCPDQE